MAEVQVIPPKAARPDTLRVAAYCRVSSDSADQLHSYAAQIRAYTQAINAHDGWNLVDIYADEGLTGTRMDKREDFNRLMADCRKGKIDKIVVKSISRFARNTRDCLATLRELSALGVTVKFEKENIDTGTLTSELMVSVSASLAQEESISPGYLEQIVRALKPLGILRAVRGSGGGYALSKPPSEINMEDVFLHLEGEISPVSCLGRGKVCQREGLCSTRAFWHQLDEHVRDFLRHQTLQNIIESERSCCQDPGEHHVELHERRP